VGQFGHSSFLWVNPYWHRTDETEVPSRHHAIPGKIQEKIRGDEPAEWMADKLNGGQMFNECRTIQRSLTRSTWMLPDHRFDRGTHPG
jgi:hypothetical protein